jgi:hypothetical protein
LFVCLLASWGEGSKGLDALRAAKRAFFRASADYGLFLSDLHTGRKLAFLERVRPPPPNAATPTAATDT